MEISSNCGVYDLCRTDQASGYEILEKAPPAAFLRLVLSSLWSSSVHHLTVQSSFHRSSLKAGDGLTLRRPMAISTTTREDTATGLHTCALRVALCFSDQEHAKRLDAVEEVERLATVLAEV